MLVSGTQEIMKNKAKQKNKNYIIYFLNFRNKLILSFIY